MSTTTNPVTHVAEVEVKNASIHEIENPGFEENGSLSKIVPIAMMNRNPITSTCGGVYWPKRKKFLIHTPYRLHMLLPKGNTKRKKNKGKSLRLHAISIFFCLSHDSDSSTGCR